MSLLLDAHEVNNDTRDWNDMGLPYFSLSLSPSYW